MVDPHGKCRTNNGADHLSNNVDREFVPLEPAAYRKSKRNRWVDVASYKKKKTSVAIIIISRVNGS